MDEYHPPKINIVLQRLLDVCYWFVLVSNSCCLPSKTFQELPEIVRKVPKQIEKPPQYLPKVSKRQHLPNISQTDDLNNMLFGGRVVGK